GDSLNGDTGKSAGSQAPQLRQSPAMPNRSTSYHAGGRPMIQFIEGFWIESIDNGGGSLQSFTLTTSGPGQDIYARFALSFYDTLFASKNPNYTDGAAVAFIESWTYYNPDGTQSDPQGGIEFTQNAVFVSNCASITFWLFANAVAAIAQINVFHS